MEVKKLLKGCILILSLENSIVPLKTNKMSFLDLSIPNEVCISVLSMILFTSLFEYLEFFRSSKVSNFFNNRTIIIPLLSYIFSKLLFGFFILIIFIVGSNVTYFTVGGQLLKAPQTLSIYICYAILASAVVSGLLPHTEIKVYNFEVLRAIEKIDDVKEEILSQIENKRSLDKRVLADKLIEKKTFDEVRRALMRMLSQLEFQQFEQANLNYNHIDKFVRYTQELVNKDPKEAERLLT